MSQRQSKVDTKEERKPVNEITTDNQRDAHLDKIKAMVIAREFDMQINKAVNSLPQAPQFLEESKGQELSFV